MKSCSNSGCVGGFGFVRTFCIHSPPSWFDPWEQCIIQYLYIWFLGVHFNLARRQLITRLHDADVMLSAYLPCLHMLIYICRVCLFKFLGCPTPDDSGWLHKVKRSTIPQNQQTSIQWLFKGTSYPFTSPCSSDRPVHPFNYKPEGKARFLRQMGKM